jgi:dihydroxynaphthoic acid synthetase
MGDYTDIVYLKDAGVARVTISRPEKMNAFRQQTLVEMTAAFADAAADDRIGVVVLTGAGDRAFCTGGEIEGELTLEAERLFLADCLRLSREIRGCGKPVIARVKGWCLAAGNELNMQCDLTIAAESARFGHVGAKLGSVPYWFAIQMLPRAVGDKRAREIVMLCEHYSAAEAQEMGWINRVVPDDDLDRAVDEWAGKLLERAPTALRLAKVALNSAMDNDLASVAHGLELLPFLHHTPEAREGLSAFLEKRKPNFRPT